MENSRDRNPLELYFRDLQNYELLTPAEEIELATKLNSIRSDLARYLYLSYLEPLIKTKKLDEIFDLSQTDLDRVVKHRRIKGIAKNFVKDARKKKYKDEFFVLPFRWELILELSDKAVKDKHKNRRKIKKSLIEFFKTRDKFIMSNLRLVIDMVKKMNINQNSTVPWADLLQEGNIGLMKAITKFDPSKGFRFSTYASWWIQQAIIRALADKARLIRFPVHIQTKEARKNNLLPKQIIHSLENPIFTDDETICLADVLAVNNSTANEANTLYTKSLIDDELSLLNPRDEKILRMYYGLDGKEHTLEQIGNTFGVTRERIRQIRERLMKTLRSNPKLRQMFEALGESDHFETFKIVIAD